MKKSVKIPLICLSVLAALVALAVGVFFIIIEPDINLFGATELDLDKLASQSQTVEILDAYGDPIDGSLYGTNKVSVKIDELPKHVANAFIAIEDKRFYDHGGVDYKRIASALLSNIKKRRFGEGASTITQQLIKNTHLSHKKTIDRKLAEMRLARKLERLYDKNRIMECYLNVLYFGSGIRGLGTASRVMFDKPASQLTLAQSAALASIINNPSKYSPYNHPENLAKRQRVVLKLMLDQKLITRSEYDDALTEQIHFGKNKQSRFVAAVIKNVCDDLNCSEKYLFNSSYTVKTAYEPRIADKARECVKNIDGYSARVLVLDNATGGVACDETNCEKFYNTRRSPASAIKPFLSYAAALETGTVNPLSQILDQKTDFGGYAPGNYKDVYRGYIAVRDGLIYSSNVAAVRLLSDVGIDTGKSVAQAFGLPFSKSDDSLAIALGGMEKGVTLGELANAYRTLANGGMYSDTCYAQTILDGPAVKYAANNPSRRAISDDTAYLLTDILCECANAGTAKKLKYSGIIAAKTGTNGDKNGNYDCYCIAYTPQYTVAVWFGAENSAMPNNITGASCCEIVKALCEDGAIKTDLKFTAPQSVAYYEIDGKEMIDTHEIYLADPLLPQRYRKRALFSKRHLPVRKNIDILDYYDSFMWE